MVDSLAERHVVGSDRKGRGGAIKVVVLVAAATRILQRWDRGGRRGDGLM